MEYSQTKKPMAETKEMIKGAIKPADPQPSIGPFVSERMKQMRNPIIRMTPGMSRRFHLGDGSEERGAPMRGRRKMAAAEKMKERMATMRKNQ